MVWKLHLSKEEEWQFNYQEVIKYKEKYGTLDIPLDYEVAYDDNITINIGNWLQKQKDKFLTGKLAKEEIAKLQMIGIKLQNADSLWNEKLNAARDYYNTYGNLLVESNYKAIISTGEFNLYQWVEQQRQLYWENKLPEEEIKIFENLYLDNYIYLVRQHSLVAMRLSREQSEPSRCEASIMQTNVCHLVR